MLPRIKDKRKGLVDRDVAICLDMEMKILVNGDHGFNF